MTDVFSEVRRAFAQDQDQLYARLQSLRDRQQRQSLAKLCGVDMRIYLRMGVDDVRDAINEGRVDHVKMVWLRILNGWTDE